MTTIIVFIALIALVAAVLITRAHYLKKIDILTAAHTVEEDKAFREGFDHGWETGFDYGKTRASYDRIMKVN